MSDTKGKPYTVVGTYPDGEPFIDLVEAPSGELAKLQVEDNRGFVVVVATFEGHHMEAK